MKKTTDTREAGDGEVDLQVFREKLWRGDTGAVTRRRRTGPGMEGERSRKRNQRQQGPRGKT